MTFDICGTKGTVRIEDVCEESFYGIAVTTSFLAIEYARLIFC